MFLAQNYPLGSVLEIITDNELLGKKHEEEQWKCGLSRWTKATEDIKNWFPFSLSLPNGKPLPRITSSQAVSLCCTHGPLTKQGPCIQSESRSSTLSMCFQLKRASCALLAWTTGVVCKGSGVFPTKGNKWCYSHQKRTEGLLTFCLSDSHEGIWKTFWVFPCFLSVLLDLRACLCILPAGFLTRIFLSCDT